MECIKCEGKTKVIDSRAYAGTRYRKRKCRACGCTFWTQEELADINNVRAAISGLHYRYISKKEGGLK